MSETSRLAGPMLLVASLVLLCASVGRGLLKRIRRSRGALTREEEESTEGRERELELDMEHQHLDVKQLLHHNHDIACFPDGSLRFASLYRKYSLLRTNGQLSDVSFKLWKVSSLPYY